MREQNKGRTALRNDRALPAPLGDVAERARRLQERRSLGRAGAMGLRLCSNSISRGWGNWFPGIFFGPVIFGGRLVEESNFAMADAIVQGASPRAV